MNPRRTDVRPAFPPGLRPGGDARAGCFWRGAGLFFVLLSTFPLVGCRSLVVSHPTRVGPALNRLSTNAEVSFETLFQRQLSGADGVLYALERARLAQIRGLRERSVADFSAAMEAIRAQDERAVVTASGFAAQTGAMLVNDNLLPYVPPSYERILLHHYQAVNYLLAGNLEAAAVEVRRGNFEQNQALKRYERTLQKAREDAAAQGVDVSQAMQRVQTAYAGLDEIAGRVKSSFQNAYASYLSGVVHELLDEPNLAYIDYKKALEIMPGNDYVQADVMRLARRLGMREDMAELVVRFPHLAGVGEERQAADWASGVLIVFFEEGLIPPKRQVKFPLPLVGLNTFATVAFPIYEPGDFQSPIPLAIADGDRLLARTALIGEVQALAVKALQERLTAMVARHVVRATAKAVAVRAAYDNFGMLAAFATGVFSFTTENADLRSWLSLPANVHIYRGELPVGRRELVFRHGGGLPRTTVEVEILPNRVTLVLLTLAGSTFYQAQATL